MKKSSILKVLIFACFASAIVFLVVKFKLYDTRLYTTENYYFVLHYIKSFGPISGLIYALIFALRTLILIIPYSAMTVLSGNVFGPWKGFLYSMAGVFLSASLAFFIGRYLGKDFVQKIVKGRIAKLDDKVEEHGFKIILFMRLSYIFPFDILNYAAGLTKIKYSQFILGTLLGLTPETFVLCFFGSRLKKPFSHQFFIAIGLLLLTIGIPILYNRYKKTKTKATNE